MFRIREAAQLEETGRHTEEQLKELMALVGNNRKRFSARRDHEPDCKR